MSKSIGDVQIQPDLAIWKGHVSFSFWKNQSHGWPYYYTMRGFLGIDNLTLLVMVLARVSKAQGVC